MKRRIEHFEKLGHTDAYALCIQAQAEEIAAGNASLREQAFGWDSRAAVAFDTKGRPVAVIAWTKQDYLARCFICQSYVIPRLRRTGLYRDLYADLCVEAKKQGCMSIASGISPTNKRMISLAKAQGRKPVAIQFECAL